MHKGYSLIEIIIYIGILAGTVSIIIATMLAGYRSFALLKVERLLTHNGDVALETLIRDIRSAFSVNTAASTLGSSPGVLVMGNNIYNLSDTTLQKQISGNPAEALTNEVRVTSLTFYHKATATPSEIVSIRMTLEAGNGIFKKTKTFYGSAVLRGSYK